ncbi:MAG: tail tape measure protein [Sphingomonadales bacterium]|nr:tail tape measure protein [Sphingomonadales bacterium]MBL0115009.1 tail tape measure protein [Sphingomonadales bacterium]
MDEEIERLVVSVRADTQGFSRDVQEMKSVLDGPFGAGVERAGKLLESSLTRALRTGKLGFEDLKQVALSVAAEIAAASIRTGLGALGQGGGSGGGGLLSLAASVLGAFAGAPGRATGGPVSPGRAYLVGERGPEVFVPTGSGSVATMGAPAARDIRVSIAINAPAASAPDMLARSSRQVARAVRLSLAREE